MKLKTDFIFLCDYASVSQDGKLSANGLFDFINVQKFPGGIGRAFMVAVVRGEPFSKHKVSIAAELVGTTKNILTPTSMDITISPNGKSNLFIELAPLGFEKPGDYRFIVYSDGKEAGHTIIQVLDAGALGKQRVVKPN